MARPFGKGPRGIDFYHETTHDIAEEIKRTMKEESLNFNQAVACIRLKHEINHMGYMRNDLEVGDERHIGYAKLRRYELKVLNQLAIAKGGEDSGEPPLEYLG